MKVKKMSVSLASGSVVEERVIEVDEFTRGVIAEYAEKFDGFDVSTDKLEKILERKGGTHRSVCISSPTLIVRYMDKFPQYYILIE
jgi:hypothetical protein